MENVVNNDIDEWYLCICGMLHSCPCMDWNLLYSLAVMEGRCVFILVMIPSMNLFE